MATLPVSDIVNISVIVSPTAAIGSNFNLGLIIGTSGVIAATTADRVRVYSGVNAMIADGFTTSSPEYVAAQIYFSQSPQPQQVAIGVQGGAETALGAVIACRAKNTNWYPCHVCNATVADIMAIAAYIEATSPASAFFYRTADAAVLSATPIAAGYETGAALPSTNISAGTATTFQIAVDNDTYGTPIYQPVTLTVAGLNTGALIAAAMQTGIQALGGAYAAVTVTFTGGVYVITSGTKGPGSKVLVVNGATNDVAVTLKIGAANGAVDTAGTGSVALALQALSYTRTLGQYSTTNAHADVGIMGYAMGANTGLANSSYALAYKQEVGVTPEALTTTQITALKTQNINYYITRGATYNLFEPGVMASGMWFDTRLGLDMLVNKIQIAVMNLLTSNAKIPQNQDGMALLVNAISAPCENAKTTGFISPGVWQAAPIMSLNTGDTLPSGYKIMAATIDSQSAADRAARKSPPIYVAIKLAGAIQYVTIQVNVNQ